MVDQQKRPSGGRTRVVYLMSGEAHLPYLVVSLWSLRAYYEGEVVVYAWPESFPIVEQIAKDKRLCITPKLREPKYRGKNDQFLDKQGVVFHEDADSVLYLDADTMIQGPVDPLLDRLIIEPALNMLVTQFNDWTTLGKVIKNRISGLIGIEGVPQNHVQECLTARWPSVNGGIFVARPGCEELSVWRRWTWAARNIFIADETALHVLMAQYYPTGSLQIEFGGRFNASPKYQPATLNDEEVSIYHFHGDSNLRPDKSLRGFEIWAAAYKECILQDVGGVRSWRKAAEAKNKWFRRLESKYAQAVN